MKALIPLFGAVFFLSSQAFAFGSDPECTTNLYMIEKREYRADQWAVFEDEIPDAVPAVVADLFQELQSLPINVADKGLIHFFTVEPEVSHVSDALKRFTWHQSAGGVEVHLMLSKQRGCLSQIVLSYRGKAKKGRRAFNSLIQDNMVPGANGVFWDSDDDTRGCEMRYIQHQRYTYTVNGQAVPIQGPDLPPFVLDHFLKYQASALHSARGTLYDQGSPKHVSGALQWKLGDEQGQLYTLRVEQEKYCDQTLSISWLDSEKKLHQLSRENEFAENQFIKEE